MTKKFKKNFYAEQARWGSDFPIIYSFPSLKERNEFCNCTDYVSPLLSTEVSHDPYNEVDCILYRRYKNGKLERV